MTNEPSAGKMKYTVSGAVLAGGRSRRMGFNKAFIESGGRSILARVLDVVSSVIPSPVIIANEIDLYSGLGAPVIPDDIPGAGSIGGIYTALNHSDADYVFVAACDMPWLDAGCVSRVVEAVDGSECVVPFISGRLHPMHAAWSKGCVEKLEAAIRAGNLRIGDLLARLALRRLDASTFIGLPIERSVENVNTREDLERTGLDEKKG